MTSWENSICTVIAVGFSLSFVSLELICVLSTGRIPHSARPPSTNQTHARLSFAVKMSIDEVVARTKAFEEEMRHLVGVKEASHYLDSVGEKMQSMDVFLDIQ